MHSKRSMLAYYDKHTHQTLFHTPAPMIRVSCRSLTCVVEGPSAPDSPHVHHQIEYRQQSERHAGESQHEGQRPEVLVDGDGAVLLGGAAQAARRQPLKVGGQMDQTQWHFTTDQGGISLTF